MQAAVVLVRYLPLGFDGLYRETGSGVNRRLLEVSYVAVQAHKLAYLLLSLQIVRLNLI